MTHYPRPRKEPYAGPIIDGPHAGDWLESYGHNEMLYWQEPMRVPSYSNELPQVSNIHQVFYLWLPSYQAWAWIQPPRRRNPA